MGIAMFRNHILQEHNPTWSHITGIPGSSEESSRQLIKRIKRDERSFFVKQYHELWDGKIPSFRQRLSLAKSHDQWVYVDAEVSKPNAETVIVHVVDLSETHQQAQRLQAQRHQLEREIQERTEALVDANVYMHTVLNSAQDGILVVDENGCFEYLNPAFLEMCGWAEADLIGHGLMKIIPRNLHRFMLERWNEVEHGIDGQFESEIIHRDGQTRIVMISQQRMIIGGNIKYGLTVKDITERRLAQRELESHRERLENKVRERTAALVEINKRLSRSEAALARAQKTAHIGSWELDLNKSRPEWSQEMFNLHGVDPKKGEPQIGEVMEFIHPDDRDHVTKCIEDMIDHNIPFEAEYRIVRPNGSVIDVLARARMNYAFGNTKHISGTIQDITERRRLEREIVSASQEEQQRIGRDLHDTLGQELTGLSLVAKALEHQIQRADPKLAGRVGELSKLAGLAASHARDIAHGLSPVDIAEEGLSAELQRMSDRISSIYGINCSFTPSGEDRVHDNAVATHLYYIARESVTNAIKHANPTEVVVKLNGGPEGHLVVTNDNHATTKSAKDAPAGIGVRLMRHRAEIIKAKLYIDHQSDGSTVTCTFPNPVPTEFELNPQYQELIRQA